MGSYRCVKNTNTSQQLLEMARVKGLALMQWEERHSATNQVKVEDNKNQVGRVVSWLVSWIGWHQIYAAGVFNEAQFAGCPQE